MSVMVTANRGKRPSCFLFYVYGFFLGLGSGVIACIFSFQGSPPASVSSRSLMSIACAINLATFIAQQGVVCVGERRAGQRSATIVIGISFTTLCTVAALAMSPGHRGIFFMAGAFSTVLYVFTIAAFSVNFKRDRKALQHADAERARAAGQASRSRGDHRGWQIPTITGDFSLPSYDFVIGGNHSGVGDGVDGGETEGDESIRRALGDDRILLPMRELLVLGIPVGVVLPAYSEVAQHSAPPPLYSEVISTHSPSHAPSPPPAGSRGSSPSPPATTPTDAPPEYSEHDRAL